MTLPSFARFPTRSHLIGAACAAMVALVALGSATPVSAGPLATFSTHGTYKWTVPSGVYKVTFDVYGASGGYVARSNTLISAGGPGGEARATFKVKPGQVFEIVVGGIGGASVDGDWSGAVGGFNGGGLGGTDGGGGGGASDVRDGGGGNPCASTMTCSVVDRIIVGGGGGGGGDASDGGAGGGLTGGSGGEWAPGGAQEGAPYSRTRTGGGSFGMGGERYIYSTGRSAAAGGGGWFGGDPGNDTQFNDGGGGGSGYFSRLAISGSFPGGTRYGDGRVIIKTA
jgi:hypothetical protein